jgi:hypothetical protein
VRNLRGRMCLLLGLRDVLQTIARGNRPGGLTFHLCVPRLVVPVTCAVAALLQLVIFVVPHKNWTSLRQTFWFSKKQWLSCPTQTKSLVWQCCCAGGSLLFAQQQSSRQFQIVDRDSPHVELCSDIVWEFKSPHSWGEPFHDR